MTFHILHYAASVHVTCVHEGHVTACCAACLFLVCHVSDTLRSWDNLLCPIALA